MWCILRENYAAGRHAPNQLAKVTWYICLFSIAERERERGRARVGSAGLQYTHFLLPCFIQAASYLVDLCPDSDPPA